MEDWERNHPESTLAKVMENVNSAVSTSRPFLECIPDSPFPARSVVLGLANLLQLGKGTHCIRRKSRVPKKKCMTSRRKLLLGFILLKFHFGRWRRRNLRLRLERTWMPYGEYCRIWMCYGTDMWNRNLINEICKWGWARLVRRLPRQPVRYFWPACAEWQKVDVSREWPSDRRRNQVIQGEAHRSKGTLLGESTNYKMVTWHNMSLQTMQDINVAMGVDEILTEVLTIKRYMKCQFVCLNPASLDNINFDRHCFSGQNIGPPHGTGALRRTAPILGTNP